jgi:hypothetical protein
MRSFASSAQTYRSPLARSGNGLVTVAEEASLPVLFTALAIVYRYGSGSPRGELEFSAPG